MRGSIASDVTDRIEFHITIPADAEVRGTISCRVYIDGVGKNGDTAIMTFDGAMALMEFLDRFKRTSSWQVQP
jgi:hypothetical protein